MVQSTSLQKTLHIHDKIYHSDLPRT